MRAIFIVLFMGLASPAYAQNSDGMAEKRPPVEESQPAQPRKSDSNTDQAALPVLIVETPDQAAAAEKREQKTSEHDAADLDAQIRSANAAEQSAATAEWQKIPTLIISIAGTAIAILALIFTIVSNRRSERIAKAQTRAYVHITKVAINGLNGEGEPRVLVSYRNFGQTPALNVSHKVFINIAFTGKVTSNQPIEMSEIGRPIGPSQEVSTTTFIDDFIGSIIKMGGTFGVFVQGRIGYRDVYCNDRNTIYKGRFHFDSGTVKDTNAFVPTEDGNDAT